MVDRRFAPQYNNDIEASMKDVTLTGTSPKSVPESLLEFNGPVIETSFFTSSDPAATTRVVSPRINETTGLCAYSMCI